MKRHIIMENTAAQTLAILENIIFDGKFPVERKLPDNALRDRSAEADRPHALVAFSNTSLNRLEAQRPGLHDITQGLLFVFPQVTPPTRFE